MRLSDDDLRAIWREPAAEAAVDRSGCLTDDEWARLLAKDLDDAGRERVISHIASCSACADEYSLLQPLQPWVAEVERAHGREQSASVDRRTWWSTWWSPRPLALAAAAAVIVLCLTNGAVLYQLLESRDENARLGTRVTEQERALAEAQKSLRESQGSGTATQAELDRLRERVAQLSTPQLIAGIIDLQPRTGEAVRGSADPQIVVTGANAPAVIVLNHAPLTARSTLEVVVAGERPEARWTGRVQQEQDNAALTVVLPTGYPDGQYVIRLFDVTRGRVPLGEYSVVIQRNAARSQ
jgi:hypothetical protein